MQTWMDRIVYGALALAAVYMVNVGGPYVAGKIWPAPPTAEVTPGAIAQAVHDAVVRGR